MTETQFTDFEFCVHQEDVEATWTNPETGMEEGRSIPITKLKWWGIRHTDFFKGRSETMIGPDHTGEPQYQTFNWNHDSFDDLPRDWQELLIKQYLNVKK